MPPAAPLKAAGHPHNRALDSVAVKYVQRRHTAAEEGGNCHARQNHAQRVDALFPRQEKDDARGKHGADESCQRHHSGLFREKQHYHHRKQARTGAHAYDTGVCQRVVQHTLQVTACQSQVSTYKHGNNRAGQTDEVDNAVGVSISLAQQRRPCFAHGKAHRTAANAHENACDEQDAQAAKDRYTHFFFCFGIITHYLASP